MSELPKINVGFGFDVDDEDDQNSSDNQHPELDIDDSLTPLERIRTLSSSSVTLHRVHFVGEICDLAKQLNFEEIKNELFSALVNIESDIEVVVRQSLCTQLSDLSDYLLQTYSNDGRKALVEFILPLIESLVVDDNSQVRSAAAETIFRLTQLLNNSDEQQLIINIFTKLVENVDEEEYRIEASDILTKCAPLFPRTIVTQVLLPKLKKLAVDQMFRVRKATACSIGSFCSVLDEDTINNELVPLYLRLCSDEIWGVRKACVESLVLVSTHSTAKTRIEVLTLTFENFVKDQSRWVRNSTFQNLGPFIATFEKENVPLQLLDYFVHMVEGSSNRYGDSDTIMYCAYNFPGVLLTVGRSHWAELREVYCTLAKDLQWKVRRTLSHSLHEVASILGTQLTESDLLPTFDLFLKDLDHVKVGVIKHLAKFLQILTPAKRVAYVSTIEDIQSEAINWRFRKLFAKQLGSIAVLFDTKVVKQTIVPLAVHLCKDQVQSVRNAISVQMGKLINHLSTNDKALMNEIVGQLRELASSKSYAERQVFARICEETCDQLDEKSFEQHFLMLLLTLADDKVANVRFVVSRAIAQKLLPQNKCQKHQARMQEILAKLSKDRDSDVRFYSIHPLLTIEEFRKIDKNWKKSAAQSTNQS